MRLMKSILITAASVYMTSMIIGNVTVTDFKAAIFAAIVLGILNFTVIPILKLITLPLRLITFGLFTLLLNGLAIKLTSDFVTGFQISGTGTGVLAAIIISLLQSVLTKMFNDDRKELDDRRERRRR